MDKINIVKKYFTALANHDINAARALLAEDYSFLGPLEQHSTADSFMESFGKLVPMITSYEYDDIFEQNDNVFAFYSFKTNIPQLESTRTAEWFIVKDGKIVASRLYFDTPDWRNFMAQNT